MNPESSSTPSVIARLPWLLALESLLLVILVYPLYLREAWLFDWVGGWEAHAANSWLARLALSEIEPFITFHFSPLILKGAVAGACLVLFMLVLLAGRFLRAFAPGSLPDWRARREPLPVGVYGAWLILVFWLAFSAWWSPTRALSLAAIPWLLAFGLFGFTLLRRGIRVGEARQLAILLMGIGSIVAVISILEATRLFNGFIFSFLHRFTDPRNAYGSLMGHNTAVGSFMLMSLFPALAMSRGGGRASRIAASVYVGLALVTMVVVQSRAVWLIGPPLIAIFIVKGSGWKKAYLQRTGALVLAFVALAILSQAISASWNPLYLRERPVARRFRDLSFEQLQKEARLRLFICSLPLVAESPWIGHGLYAFQYVYPKAQGDYFAAHPDTRLGYTNKRSHMAHNEYLQVTVEQGLVGLLLLLVSFAELFRRGWRARDELGADERPLHAAFGFATLGLALGAAVDFPFHIPQLVLPWMFCLAAYSSIIPGAAENSEASEPPSDAKDSRPKDRRAISGTTLRLDRVFGLSLALVVLCISPIAGYFFVQSVAVDTKFLHASSYLSAVRNRQAGMHRDAALSALEGIVKHLRHVTLLQPFHGHARFLLGEAHYTLGRTLAEGAMPEGRISQVQAIQIAKAYESAIEYIQESMKTLRTHHSYYILALCYRGLAELAPPDRQVELMKEYQAQLENSVHYAPGYEPALYLLAEWLASQPGADRQRIAGYRRAIQTHAPRVFRDQYVAEALARINQSQWDEAVRATESLLDVDPADPRFLDLAMYAHLHRGEPADRDRVVELCDRITAASASIEPPGAQEALLTLRVNLYRAIATRDWAEALKWLIPFEGRDLTRLAWLSAIETNAKARLGSESGTALITRPDSASEEAWEGALAEKELSVSFRLFDDVEAARAAVDRRLFMGGEPPVGFWVEAAALADRVGDEDLRERVLQRLADPERRLESAGIGRQPALPSAGGLSSSEE